ncbi:MAG: tetratricopeptide repeat protein [Thermoanaerobaculia bacterium]|nr:tetratricopeptide repeat protein [Thermoanaerobaculia bacterium]
MKWSESEPGRLALKAETLQTKGDEAAALETMERALALSPNDALVHAHAGCLLLDLKQTEPAIAAFKRSVGLRPDLVHAWSGLGTAYMVAGLARKAAFCFLKSIEIYESMDPTECSTAVAGSTAPFVAVLTMLAAAQLTFSPKHALESAERALKIDPAWDEAISLRDRALRLVAGE